MERQLNTEADRIVLRGLGTISISYLVPSVTAICASVYACRVRENIDFWELLFQNSEFLLIYTTISFAQNVNSYIIIRYFNKQRGFTSGMVLNKSCS